jgi:cell division protein FtsI/penicillin-binding protein 2
MDALFPSMFHRRLAMLAGVFALGAGIVATRIVWLGVGRHEDLERRAEAKLVARRWTPTVRGKILDRKGRVLAADRASYDLVLPFGVINGGWATDRARQTAPRAFRDAEEGGWGAWNPARREASVATLAGVYQRHQDAAWSRLAGLLGTTTGELDARRGEIIVRIERRYRAVVERRRAAELAGRAEDAGPLSEPELRALERRTGEPIWEQGATHPIATRLGDEVAIALDRLEGAETEIEIGETSAGVSILDRVEIVPGLRVVNSGDREYPTETVAVEIDERHLPGPLRRDSTKRVEVDGVAVHVLGWMREGVQDEDLPRRKAAMDADHGLRSRAIDPEGRDRGFYDPTVLERVGAAGVEQSMEASLRGLRGERVRRLEVGETVETAMEPGRDVTLTLDIMLQARVQAVMGSGTGGVGLGEVQRWNQSPPTMRGPDGRLVPNPAFREIGTPLHGAAVVLDVDSGEVLAMVSTPTFLRSQMGVEGSTVFDLSAGGAYLNRAIARPYPPGSVAKALMLNEAAKRGLYAVGDMIECNGHLYPNQLNAFRCWIYKMTQFDNPTTHTTQFGRGLRGAEALMVSCNIFFFTLGQRLGAEGVEAAYRDFGVGRGWDLGIGWEYPGVVGFGPGKPMSIQDAVQMGIGQGPVAWTPMHAANAYATLARMGVEVPPTLIAGRRTGEPKRIGLVPETAAEALEGLGLSVNAELGTGHHILIDGTRENTFDHDPTRIWIWGKTGTAAGSDTMDPDGKAGPLPPETVSGDHSWYVVLAGSAAERRPRYAVAVMMEYAGSGGKVSGPICNQIIHALVAEGYLPGAEGPQGEENPARSPTEAR